MKFVHPLGWKVPVHNRNPQLGTRPGRGTALAVVKKAEPVVARNLSAPDLKFLYRSLVQLRPEHPRLILAGDTHFLAARQAVAAGYKPENITVADANLYSDILGALITGSPFPVFKFTGDNEALWEQYREARADNLYRRAAFALWVMKRSELEGADHLADRLEAFEDDMPTFADALHDSLVSTVNALTGIRYEHRTVPQVIATETAADTAVIVIRPLYTGRATKGFRFDQHIEYKSGVEAYSFGRDFAALYEASKMWDGVYLWSVPATATIEDTSEVVHVKEVRADRVSRWLCTRPEALGDAPFLQSYSRRAYAPYPLPMWGQDDELRPDSLVEFIPVKEGTVFYYRDLWAHKLGATAGDRYLLMLIDRKVYSAVIMNLGQFTHMTSDYLFEQSGFSAPSTRHPHLHRLLMWSLTCRQFGDDMLRIGYKKNRIFAPVGLETTCISKYRKLKSNNGIFEVAFRERYPNGMYRILYRADFREERYTDCIRRVLEEDKAQHE